MLKIYQTTFGEGMGDCWSACLASILELPLDTVPKFCVDNADGWFEDTLIWMERFGLAAADLVFGDGLFIPRGYWIASGKSPRGNFKHSVIYYRNEMAHDPHPDNIGLDGKPEFMTIIYQLQPKPVIWRACEKETLCAGETVNGIVSTVGIIRTGYLSQE